MTAERLDGSVGAHRAPLQNQPLTAAAFRAGAFFAFGTFSANSKPTLPFSNFRWAEKGRPFLEMNLGRRSVLPAVMSFWTCSFGISRCRITLPTRNVQVFSAETAFSQA